MLAVMREDEKVIALPGIQGAEAGEETHHARKQRHLKATQKDGVRLVRRNGQVAYIAYSTPYALEYFPSIAGAPEQIQCRIGDSCFTVHGYNLLPLLEDLQKKQCDSLRESEHGKEDAAALGVPYIATLTVRMWI
jgi:hypothetical protein